ncbi:MAG: lipopolysaccharide transport periplasmic protein LptA [Halioglobus sp.]|nr:lipopolysaccharide transport periplasmic protein LptA [Halioglobus sp.]
MYQRSAEGRLPRLPASVAVVLAWLIVAADPTFALPDDRAQPIHISADKALRDDRQGVTVYSGNVQMNQGSMHIQADTLTIYHLREQADKIVAQGSPAKLRQRPDVDKGPVHAQAGVIEYYQSEERVHLQANARIEQEGSMVTGDSIDYFIAEQLVKADSDQTLEGNRVQVVIQPSMQEKALPAARKDQQPPAATVTDQTDGDADGTASGD